MLREDENIFNKIVEIYSSYALLCFFYFRFFKEYMPLKNGNIICAYNNLKEKNNSRLLKKFLVKRTKVKAKYLKLVL